MRLSRERRAKRWVLRELDRIAARASSRAAFQTYPLTRSSEPMPRSSAVAMQSGTLPMEHRARRRKESCSKDGERWIRTTQEGHRLQRRTHEILARRVAACNQNRGAGRSTTPQQKRTGGVAASRV
jgi:hypothetical protein